jgi:16S rRNA G966 N2-methylase RsmD
VKLSQELNFLNKNHQVLPTYFIVIEKKSHSMTKKMKRTMEINQTKLTQQQHSNYLRNKVMRSN